MDDSASWLYIESRPDFVIATWRPILAVVWRGETSLEGAKSLRSATSEFASRHPRGIGLLTIIGARAPLPAPAVRKALAQLLVEGSEFIKCSAIIIEGSGFRASTVRSVVTGLTLLAQQAYPHRVCAVDETVQLFSRHLPNEDNDPIGQSALRISIDQLRQLVEP
jgi:hypothetical protein